jgi:hypothetical protein
LELLVLAKQFKHDDLLATAVMSLACVVPHVLALIKLSPLPNVLLHA